MTQKKFLSSNEELILMTDDLVDRLEPDNLVENKNSPIQEESLYSEDNKIVISQETKICIVFYFEQNFNSPIIMDGVIQLLSFGEEGWRISVDDIDPQIAIKLAKQVASESLLEVQIMDIAKLTGDIDVTVHFGSLNGKCSVTVAADNGSTI
jgi:hypothetical protein